MGISCPAAGHRIKVSPLMSSLDNGKIASSEYGMPLTALLQGP